MTQCARRDEIFYVTVNKIWLGLTSEFVHELALDAELFDTDEILVTPETVMLRSHLLTKNAL